jgi:hypothetical protein
MTPEQVDKSIRQMRSMFGFFGILTSLGTIFALPAIGDDPSFIFVLFLEGLLAVCFWMAFSGLGKRNSTGLIFARICSGIFVLGFPLLTIFGIVYLIKLWKPEMKQAFEASQTPSLEH